MTANHSPTPWRIESSVKTPSEARASVISGDGKLILYEECNEHELPPIIADFDRIVACVNACEGLPNEELPRLREFIKRYLELHHEGGPPA